MMEPKADKEVKIYSDIQRPTKYFFTTKCEIKDTLTTKDAVKFLLDGTLRLRVCKYCLNITQNLNELDEIIVVAGKCGLYEVTIKDIVASFYPVKVSGDTNFPNKICSDCLDRAIQCYLFTQQCEQAGRALNNYLEDLNEKFNKLDPMEPLKRRGKPKLYLNHNILNMECKNVIDYAEPLINLINLNALPNDSELTDLECPKCWQVLPNITSLVNHEKSHLKSSWYYCKKCGKAFVKYTQLKKHKRNEHLQKFEDIKLEKKFTCKQCGISNESLSKHLLHVEKHSFTKSLGELIMNPKGNCAMCFNKAYNMVHLNETMHMHGGGAGLTGEKSISNIVTSVFPDKSYTFRELSIPTSILHIIKCKVDISENFLDKMKIDVGNTQLEMIYMEYVKRFLLSKPEPDIARIFANINNKKNRDILIELIKLINADIDKCENATSFEWCHNELINYDLTENVIKLSEIAVQDETQVKNVFQSYVEPILTEKNVLNVEETNNRNCNICWVFKKATCPSCKQYNMKIQEFQNLYEERDLQKKRCSSCYIFAKVGFCDVCHNILEVDKDNNKLCLVSENKIDQCLSNNINKDTCICCKKSRNLNKYVYNPVSLSNIFTATLPYEKIEENHLPLKNMEGIPTYFKSTETLKQVNNTHTHNMKLSISADYPMDIEMDLAICEESKLKDVLLDVPIRNQHTIIDSLQEQDKLRRYNTLLQIQTVIKFNGKIKRKITLHYSLEDKICKHCLNKLITSYIFILNIRNNRNRLDECVGTMVENLKHVDENKNILIEINQNVVFPAISEDLLVKEGAEEFLEDEFRIPDSDTDSDAKSTHSTSTDDIIRDNPARKATKTYAKRVSINGFQQSVPIDKNLSIKTNERKQKCLKKRLQKFTCPLCYRHFVSDYFLKKHVIKHVYETTQCNLCNNKFKSNFDCTEHKKVVHILNLKTFTSCGICGRSFSNMNKLKNHSKKHSFVECPLCNKIFKSQLFFARHMVRHQMKFNSNRKHIETCSFCERDYSNENELSLHVNKFHLQIKPFNCDMCEKQFYTELNLQSHKKLHNVKSREECTFCHKTFMCRKSLVIHLRKHIDIKPHYCPVCSKSFYSESSMKCHMKKVHGGRYCCRICRHIVNSNIDLRNHLKVAHTYKQIS